jgi:hypothetical protein
MKDGGINKMELNNTLHLKGSVNITLWDKKTGQVVQEIQKDNLVVTCGKELLAGLIGGLDSSTEVTYMAVGTNNTAPAAGNTTLGTEVYRETIGSATKETTTTTNDTCQFVVTLDEGDSGANEALTEAGLFGSESGNVADGNPDTGVLLSRVTFSTITKTSSLALTITWRIQFT